MALLEIRDVTYRYEDGVRNKHIVLDHLDASFEAGCFYAILGASGCGKTTLLSLVAALDKPQGGTIMFKGHDIRTIGNERYRRDDIAIVFQSYNIIPYMTGVENVLVAMGITDNQLPHDKKAQAYKILASLGIDHYKADRRVNRLSGGEQQRVAIGRALATDVAVVVADEPTGNLDPDTAGGIIGLLADLAHEHGKCVIVATHDQNVARRADVIFKLGAGGRRLVPMKGRSDDQPCFAVDQ